MVVADALVEYGYRVSENAASWQDLPSAGTSLADFCAAARQRPRLRIVVDSHEEREGHTWYLVSCRLDPPSGLRAEWMASKRLQHIRDGLHAPCKELIGATAYTKCFGAAPFAAKGGLPGTTARLREWFIALADAINSGACPPRMAHMALTFLEAPPPRASLDAASAAPSSVAASLQNTDNQNIAVTQPKTTLSSPIADCSEAIAAEQPETLLPSPDADGAEAFDAKQPDVEL